VLVYIRKIKILIIIKSKLNGKKIFKKTNSIWQLNSQILLMEMNQAFNSILFIMKISYKLKQTIVSLTFPMLTDIRPN